MTTPGIVEQMLGPPTFADHPVPTFQEFCADWVASYWTHAEPELGRVFLIFAEGERVGMLAHNEVVRLPDGKRCTEIDTWLRGADVLGRGFGSRAVTQLCRRLAVELQLDVAFLQPSARNQRAIRAYSKAGFERSRLSGPAAASCYQTELDYHDSLFLVRSLETLYPRLEEVDVGAQREPLLELLLLADDSERQVRAYWQRGRCLAVSMEGRRVAVAILKEAGDATEIVNIAVASEFRGIGLGTLLLNAIAESAAARGQKILKLATAFEDTDAVSFYLHQGFRPVRLEPNWFTQERGYPAELNVRGVPVRDRIWFERPVRS